MSETEAKRPFAVMPLMYLEGDWKCARYDFAAGVHLIRAEPPVLQEMEEAAFPYGQILSLAGEVQWLLARPWYGHPQDKSLADGFLHRVVEWFVAALNLVRANCTIAPFIFKATMAEGGVTVEDIRGCGDYLWARPERPHGYSETFPESDLELLGRVWSKLWDFLMMMVPATGRDLGPPESVEMDDGGELIVLASMPIPYLYATFDGTSESLLGRSRLRRALALFEQGTHLPEPWAFISMFVVLETLLAVKGGEKSDVICNRFAGVWGSLNGAGTERPAWSRVRRAYDERNRIVHGHQLMDAVPEAVQKHTFALVRETLRGILLDGKLFDLYNPEKTSEQELRKYLRDLGEMDPR